MIVVQGEVSYNGIEWHLSAENDCLAHFCLLSSKTKMNATTNLNILSYGHSSGSWSLTIYTYAIDANDARRTLLSEIGHPLINVRCSSVLLLCLHHNGSVSCQHTGQATLWAVTETRLAYRVLDAGQLVKQTLTQHTQVEADVLAFVVPDPFVPTHPVEDNKVVLVGRDSEGLIMIFLVLTTTAVLV